MLVAKRKLMDSDRNETKNDNAPLFEVVIIGGGLSGLMIARCLNSSNVNKSNTKDVRRDYLRRCEKLDIKYTNDHGTYLPEALTNSVIA